MSVEIQVESAALAKAVANAVQARLFQTCFPFTAELFVDHVDVAAAIEVVADSSQQILVRVPLDVYLVRRSDLEANLTPAGASTPSGRVVAVFRIAATGAVVSIDLIDLRSDPPNPMLDVLLDSVRTAIPRLADLNASPLFTTLGLPVPTTTQVVLVGTVVAIRFDPVGPPAVHIFAEQAWGLFIDGPTVVTFVSSRLSGLTVPGLTLTPHWTPVGKLPSVTIDWRFKPNVPNPFTFTATGVIGAGLSLAATSPTTLRTTINWALHDIDLGDFSNDILDLMDLKNRIENFARGLVAYTFDPQIVGGTKIDDRSFFIDRSLPPLTLGGAQLRYASLIADPSGMTLGGAVQPIYAEWNTLSLSDVFQFGRPSWFGTCRKNGNPPKTLKITDVINTAGVSFSSYGSFCGADMATPDSTAAAFLETPDQGAASETVGTVGFRIPAVVAQSITEDVTLILRTARGVRLIDFDHPIVKIDSNGNVDFTPRWINNCLYLTEEQVHVINVAKGREGGTVDDFKQPPLEWPEWGHLITTGHGFEVQLVSLSGLEPGELVRFRSSYHAINISSDADGRALVPVFLPMSEDIQPASIERVNRQNVAGKFQVKTALFVRSAMRERGVQNRIELGVGGARLTREFGDRVTRDAFGVGGISFGVETSSQKLEALGGRDEVALNPQPLPHSTDLFASFAQEMQGLRDVVPIPGFETEPLAVARMNDGSAVLLQSDSSGRLRVAGSFSGPIDVLSIVSDWAMGTTSSQVVVFEIQRG